jgi:argininosuccinate lyase
LGSAALAGSPLKLDRGWVAKELGFSRPTANSLDAVSDRDYLLDLAYALSMVMTHLSRLGEEIVLFCSQEFGFVSLDDSFSTGSSLMPQKRNPDVAELLRGRASRAYGLLIQLLTLVKGQPLAYNRDMQEDKEQTFAALDQAADCLAILPGLLGAMNLQTKRMEQACQEGFLEATDAADYLVGKGVPFRAAHEAVGRAIKYCLAKGWTLSQLGEGDWKSFHPSFDQGVLKVLPTQVSIEARQTYGGTSSKRVREALRHAKARLKNDFKK